MPIIAANALRSFDSGDLSREFFAPSQGIFAREQGILRHRGILPYAQLYRIKYGSSASLAQVASRSVQTPPAAELWFAILCMISARLVRSGSWGAGRCRRRRFGHDWKRSAPPSDWALRIAGGDVDGACRRPVSIRSGARGAETQAAPASSPAGRTVSAPRCGRLSAATGRRARSRCEMLYLQWQAIL